MLKKIIITMVILIVAIVVIIGASIDTLIKHGIENMGSSIVGTQVKVGGVNVSLLSGQLTLSDLTVANPKGFSGEYALQVKQVSIDLSLSSLLSKIIQVKDIYISAPQIHYDVGLTGSNIDKLSGHAKASSNNASGPSSEKVSQKSGKHVVINRLVINDAYVTGSIAVLKTGIKLKQIVLTNLGAQPGGVTIAQVVSQVLVAVVSSLSHAGIETFSNTVKGVFDGVVNTFKQ